MFNCGLSSLLPAHLISSIPPVKSSTTVPLSPQKGITGKFHSVVPSLDEDKHIFSSHIVVKELNHNLLPTIQDLLRDWNIHCETIQLETVEMACRQND